jgi:AraC-like DNA-binding protein
MRPRPRPGNEPLPRGVRLFDPATLARLCRARDYLTSRYRLRTPLADAAREAGLSPFYFSRLFAQAFDETPHELVTRLRIERAKRLLLADNESVTEICFDVGYESLGSFSTRFSTLTGLSPAAFRREARRLWGGWRRRWPLFYVPACYRHFLFGAQEPRSASSAGSVVSSAERRLP